MREKQTPSEKRSQGGDSPETSERKTGGGVAAVDRAFLILQAFREGDPSLSLTDIAKRTGYYKSTILRLLQSLERFAYIVKKSDGRYMIGPAAWRLGILFQRELRVEERLMPFLRELSERTSESVAFWIPLLNSQPPQRLCLLRIESPHAVGHNFRVGDTLPLADCEDEALGTTGRLLRAFIFPDHPGDETIRKARFFTSCGVRDPEILGIAALVSGPGNELVGGLTLSAPTSRRDAAWAQSLVPLVVSTANRATLAMGGATAGSLISIP